MESHTVPGDRVKGEGSHVSPTLGGKWSVSVCDPVLTHTISWGCLQPLLAVTSHQHCC